MRANESKFKKQKQLTKKVNAPHSDRVHRMGVQTDQKQQQQHQQQTRENPERDNKSLKALPARSNPSRASGRDLAGDQVKPSGARVGPPGMRSMPPNATQTMMMMQEPAQAQQQQQQQQQQQEQQQQQSIQTKQVPSVARPGHSAPASPKVQLTGGQRTALKIATNPSSRNNYVPGMPNQPNQQQQQQPRQHQQAHESPSIIGSSSAGHPSQAAIAHNSNSVGLECSIATGQNTSTLGEPDDPSECSCSNSFDCLTDDGAGGGAQANFHGPPAPPPPQMLGEHMQRHHHSSSSSNNNNQHHPQQQSHYLHNQSHAHPDSYQASQNHQHHHAQQNFHGHNVGRQHHGQHRQQVHSIEGDCVFRGVQPIAPPQQHSLPVHHEQYSRHQGERLYLNQNHPLPLPPPPNSQHQHQHQHQHQQHHHHRPLLPHASMPPLQGGGSQTYAGGCSSSSSPPPQPAPALVRHRTYAATSDTITDDTLHLTRRLNYTPPSSPTSHYQSHQMNYFNTNNETDLLISNESNSSRRSATLRDSDRSRWRPLSQQQTPAAGFANSERHYPRHDNGGSLQRHSTGRHESSAQSMKGAGGAQHQRVSLSRRQVSNSNKSTLPANHQDAGHNNDSLLGRHALGNDNTQQNPANTTAFQYPNDESRQHSPMNPAQNTGSIGGMNNYRAQANAGLASNPLDVTSGALNNASNTVSSFEAAATFCPPILTIPPPPLPIGPMAITSHRTNSPWMRLSSIILTPVGIVIAFFIVISPLLHYLM